MTAPRLTPDSFFSRAWRGRGEVRTLFGRRLRTFGVEFRGRAADGGYALDEHVAYDGGGELQRAWRLEREPDGSLLGLEPHQGGRMFVRQTGRGLHARYDRPKFLPGPNVANLVMDLQAEPDGTVRGEGRTLLFGVLPVFATRLAFTPLEPQARG